MYLNVKALYFYKYNKFELAFYDSALKHQQVAACCVVVFTVR